MGCYWSTMDGNWCICVKYWMFYGVTGVRWYRNIYPLYLYNLTSPFYLKMGDDRLTRELKKTLQRAKSDHDSKMGEIEVEDTSKNGCLGDW